jgi:hypothetical protein
VTTAPSREDRRRGRSCPCGACEIRNRRLSP